MSNISFPFKFIAANYGIADSRTPIFERTNYEFCTIEYIYKGKGFLEINGESFFPSKDSVYILQKGSRHKYWPDKNDPWAKLFFVIDGPLMETLFDAYNFSKTYFIQKCPQLRKFFDEMLQLRNNIADADKRAGLIFHSFLQECHTLFYTEIEQLPPSVLLDLKKFLDNSVEKKITLNKFCLEKNCSCANIIRQFKKYFGCTPYDYLMRRRMEEAGLMLRHSALSIKEISSRLQFADQYYFSNYFKKKNGISPQKYRKIIYNRA